MSSSWTRGTRHRRSDQHSSTRRCSAFAHCPASRLRERSTTCPSATDPHRLSISRDTRLSATRWRCKFGRSHPATCVPWGFRCCVDATSSRAMRRCCSSARTPRSCIGERTIRSDAAPPCRPCRRRCFGRWSESWATSSSGISLKPSRPRSTSTPASLMAGQRSSYGHRCRPPRSHSLPSQPSARSIREQPVGDIRTMVQVLDGN